MASPRARNAEYSPLGKLMMDQATHLVAAGHVKPEDRNPRNRNLPTLGQREIWERAKAFTGHPGIETLSVWITGRLGPPNPDPDMLRTVARALECSHYSWQQLFDDMLGTVDATPRGITELTLDVTGLSYDERRALEHFAILLRRAHGTAPEAENGDDGNGEDAARAQA